MAKMNNFVPSEVDDKFDNGNEDDQKSKRASFVSLPKGNKRVSANENDDDDDDNDEIRKKKMKREKDLFKQPTAEELNQLRETETLFHSNLFRLQIEEVLNAMRIKEKYKKLFETWFVRFKRNIKSIQESEEFSLGSTENCMGLNSIIPQPDVPIDNKGVFRFSQPSDIRVIGSYSLGCITGPDVAIDIMIEMPSKFFQKLDYQNYRYMKKRAMYLAWIASNLDEELAESKKFMGNSWMPNLKIVPKGGLGKRVKIHVHLAVEEGSFKFNRFLPEKNSVRAEWYFSEKKSTKSSPGSFVPTQHYNSIILHDLTMSRVSKNNEKIITEYPNLRDGIILLKIWLRQRQLNVSHDSFTNHIMTMYVLYLLSEKKLNTFMSSYQIVRNVWNSLALSDWTKNGLTMCPDNECKARVVEYHKYYDCVFLDSSGYHNLAAHMSADTYHWIRSEAERTVKCLDNPNLDSFQALFMRPVPFYRTFDNVLCFNDRVLIEKIVVCESSMNDELDYGPNKRAQAIKIMCRVLKEGLGNRVSNMYVQSEKEKEWDLSKKPPEGIDKIIIGLSLDPQFCFNVIDKGPHANLPEAAAFRKFWGNKSELRRFQDGSICEALVWIKGKQTIADKRIVCKKIVHYLLKEKFDLSKDQYVYMADDIEEFLRLKKIRVTKMGKGTGEEATLRVLQVFDTLEKELTSLTDLPLSISGVEGFSPVFRYTDVFPPLATDRHSLDDVNETQMNYTMLNEIALKEVPRWLPQINVSVQLAISGKWPDELEAVRQTKAAFNIQIAECLRKQHGLEARAHFRWVDVFKEGFLFRLEVAHQKEIALLKRQITEDRVEKYRDNDESLELEKRLFHLPKLSSALHGLHSQQPSFGPSCCLAKRWLSAHLLDDSHMPEVVVELLIASMYHTPDPYKSAQAPQVAFLRFLEFFARHHWSTEPIFVNFNNEMTRDEIVVVENSFKAARDTHPPIFISTPYDHCGSIWSSKAPTPLILNRIGSLAKEALRLVDEQLNDAKNISFRSLFRAPITEYDCLIRLKSSLNPRRGEFHDLNDNYPIVNWQPFSASLKHKIPVIEFNPVQCYLRELRRGYDQVALFFHDTYGGSVIGVLLKPASLEPKEFKVANLHCRKLNNDGKLVLDAAAMIEDFSILGKGIVKSIDIQSKRLMTLN